MRLADGDVAAASDLKRRVTDADGGSGDGRSIAE
jgi:hypothetical protein